MPRRTYSARQGRRRAPLPPTLDYRPSPVAARVVVAPPPVGPIAHFDGCSNRGDVQTFLGRRGDLMARCLSCKALAVLEPRGAAQ